LYDYLIGVGGGAALGAFAGSIGSTWGEGAAQAVAAIGGVWMSVVVNHVNMFRSMTG
jgi:outer membrane lipoprotein SlyB